MSTTYTAIVQESEGWWIGWIEEVAGVNSQGRTREELIDNLRDALAERWFFCDGSLGSLASRER